MCRERKFQRIMLVLGPGSTHLLTAANLWPRYDHIECCVAVHKQRPTYNTSVTSIVKINRSLKEFDSNDHTHKTENSWCQVFWARRASFGHLGHDNDSYYFLKILEEAE